MKKILVCGAGGFIGGAMVKRLKNEGFWVRGVDIKKHEFIDMSEVADEFIQGDLRDPRICDEVSADGIMKSINLRRIWVERVTSLPERMTRMLCITRQ